MANIQQHKKNKRSGGAQTTSSHEVDLTTPVGSVELETPVAITSSKLELLEQTSELVTQ